LQKLRRHGRMPESDADQLAGVTRVPGLFWVGLFGVVNVIALLVGAGLLAGPILGGIDLPGPGQ
jgi:hypothetical protein